jgi:glycosyltransferase involved in cell wall biosynthesis
MTVGIPPGFMDRLELQTGHARVWREVVNQFSRQGLLDVGGNPDVWFFNAHDGNPGLNGKAVAVAYEAGWGTPDLDALHTPAFVEAIDASTRSGVAGADAVVVPSESSKWEIIERYEVEPERINVVPLGVDHDIFSPHDDGTPNPVKRHPYYRGQPYIVFVNSLEPRKNVDVVRSSVEDLARQGNPHLLVLITSPPRDRGDSSEIIRRALEPFEVFPERIIALSNLSDRSLASVMRGATVYCAPSLHEGFGLTVLEAMAVGAPVVVSDRTALPEVVDNAGIVVSPTSEGFLAAIKSIADDPLIEMQLRKRSELRALEFSWKNTANGWINVARSLLR